MAMLVASRVARVVLAAALLWSGAGEAASMAAVKLCGRQLSEIMTRVCHAYNSPSWDVPTVVEQPGAARRKRQLGIADECCVIGCTWDQLTEYCSVSAYSESPLEDLEAHIIADRSAEVASAGVGATSEAGGTAGGAAGGSAGGARRREDMVKSVRAAPVVGTVSPLLTWGRTLNTDLPAARAERDRYAYVVYT